MDWIENNGEVIGICFGYDFCAEHEWGIKDLREAFGISDVRKSFLGRETRVCGPAARQVTVDPKGLTFRENGTEAFLVFSPRSSWQTDSDYEDMISRCADRHLSFRREGNLVCAWSGKDFGIQVRGKQDVEALRNLSGALHRKDALIYLLGSNNPFGGTGLCIVQASKLPEEVADAMREADEDSIKLKKADEETGIKEKLESASKRYFALSPRWAKKFEDRIQTSYPVVYWLNPMEQRQNNSGWYSVEDLELWAQDKGPVPKKKNA
jgi:hypothetical protein